MFDPNLGHAGKLASAVSDIGQDFGRAPLKISLCNPANSAFHTYLFPGRNFWWSYFRSLDLPSTLEVDSLFWHKLIRGKLGMMSFGYNDVVFMRIGHIQWGEFVQLPDPFRASTRPFEGYTRRKRRCGGLFLVGRRVPLMSLLYPTWELLTALAVALLSSSGFSFWGCISRDL